MDQALASSPLAEEIVTPRYLFLYHHSAVRHAAELRPAAEHHPQDAFEKKLVTLS